MVTQWIPATTQEVVSPFSDDGRVLPPMIINKGKALYMGWYAKVKKKDLGSFGVSEQGWSNEGLGLQWLKEPLMSKHGRGRLAAKKYLFYVPKY